LEKDKMTYSITIGILAYNEASQITKTIASLQQQSIFQSNSNIQNIEIIVVPNGCTDRTDRVAEQAFSQDAWTAQYPQVECHVMPIAAAGKSNAWNIYVHELSASSAKYMFLMDADIELNEPTTLERMLANLEAKPEAWVAIDHPLKDVQLRHPKNLIERLSARVSDQDGSQKGITGQLYCGRTTKLREIWMPQGLAVEDGFLRAMILTDRFTGPEVFDRIAYTPGATHVYEAYATVKSLLRHEKRIVIGTIVNQFIFDYLWRTCSSELDAGTLVRQNNQQNPQWVAQVISNARIDRGRWLLNPDHTFRRLSNLKRYPGLKMLKRLPLELAASVADWLVFYGANRDVHAGRGLGYW
jgi:glycosyltransferase involved in cell wall biosynthesis